MKITIYLKSVLLKSSIILLGIAILLVTASHAGDKPVQGLVGPLFSDPEQFQDMPESWRSKPLQYDPTHADADIAVTLDGQLYHTWEPLIQKYAKNNNLKIAVTHGTCGLSAGKLIRKSTDIGAFCCPPDITDRLPGLQFHTLGIAVIALLVHPDNPSDVISTNYPLYRVYSFTTWEDKYISNPAANKLVDYLMQQVDNLDIKYSFIPVSRLRQAGWKFKGNELTGEPG